MNIEEDFAVAAACLCIANTVPSAATKIACVNGPSLTLKYSEVTHLEIFSRFSALIERKSCVLKS